MSGGEARKTAAIIGGGVIGGGWAARFLLMGWDVNVLDPDPQAVRNLGGILDNARRALPGLAEVALPPEGRLTCCTTISAAVKGAVWIQESVPERLALKRRVFQTIQEHCGPGAIIASSSSGLRPSELQGCASRPGEIIVAHPLNPVYLLPLVELVGSEANGEALMAMAAGILADIGMSPLRLGREAEAHVAGRLLEAVWREALRLVRDGVATTGEIDAAISLGFGLRWAQMGVFETCRIASGEAGMRHFTGQSGTALKWPWTKLMDVPDLSKAVIDTIATQSDAQSGARTIRDLERIRDTNLVAIMRALKAQNWGAGAALKEHDRRLAPPAQIDITRPIITVARAVPLDWTDYNGHMNEAKYLQAFGDATDRFMEIVGCDADYIATGGSYFTAETHIRHVGEVLAGASIRVETLCLLGEGVKMQLFHQMFEGERLLATGEHMLLHVSLKTRRPAPPAPRLAARLAGIAAAHARLARPEGVGRAVRSSK